MSESSEFQPAKSTGTTRATRTGLIFAHCTMSRRQEYSRETHTKGQVMVNSNKKTENPVKTCDLDPPHTSTQTPRRV